MPDQRVARNIASYFGGASLGKITWAGDEDLRRPLVIGATAVIQQAMRGRGHHSCWPVALTARKPPKLAAMALANTVARIAGNLIVTERSSLRRLNAAAAVPT